VAEPDKPAFDKKAIEETYEKLDTGSDRTAIIVGAALLEDALQHRFLRQSNTLGFNLLFFSFFFEKVLLCASQAASYPFGV
jgi:hypothetical protein